MPDPRSTPIPDLLLETVLRAFADGTLSSRAYLEALLERHAQVEPVVRAFVWRDDTRARALADTADLLRGRQHNCEPLLGVPVAIKDVIDTVGIPTECGSPAFRGNVPERNARVVDRLVDAGAYVLGKTVTAELAYFTPGPTVNPWDPTRTPGGSSMGSAAAVAAGLVPLALGTQTNGSVLRPAAFCGVVGFKPTHSRLPMDGILPFSHSNDQGGVFARDVAGVAVGASVWAGEPLDAWVPDSSLLHATPAPVLAAVRTSDWHTIESASREAVDTAVTVARRAGASVRWIGCPSAIDDLASTHRTIMSREGADNLASIRRAHDARLSKTLRDYLDEGAQVTDQAFATAWEARQRATEIFREWMHEFDALLVPASPGEAPPIDTTGDPMCQTRWQCVGAPAVSLPTGRGPRGLPVAVQVVGSHGTDARLLWVCAWLETHLPPIGVPNLIALSGK